MKLMMRIRTRSSCSLILLACSAAAAGAFFVPPPTPPPQSSSPPPRPQVSPFLSIVKSLQLLGLAALGPLASVLAAPPTPAVAALDLPTVSKLQDEAFKATNRFNWAEAEVAWGKVLELDPKNAAAYSNRGNTRTSMGKCTEAVADFNRAIELAPAEPDPNLGRGVARECLGQFAEAIEVGRLRWTGWIDRSIDGVSLTSLCTHARLSTSFLRPPQDYEVSNKKNLALTGAEDPVTYNNRGAWLL